MKSCKVIATCFIGKRVQEETKVCGFPPRVVLHSMNFPTRESVLDLIKLNLEQELSVDPGVPCDTIIVNNDTGWQRGNEFLDSIDNTPTHSGLVRVVHRENWGRSFGAYNEAYQRFKDLYTHWIFTEDDILINGDRYFKIAIDTWERHPRAGFISLLGLSYAGLYGDFGRHLRHAHSGAGLAHVSILNLLNEKLGALPHSRKEASQSYEECIYQGEIAFTNEIQQLGYELRTVESEYPLYWFAYDNMRGIRPDPRPNLAQLLSWGKTMAELWFHRNLLGSFRKRR